MNRQFEGLGKILKEKRMQVGLSQEELAIKLGFTSAQMVSNWERGKCYPPLKKLKSLVKELNLDAESVLSYFLTDQEKILRASLGMEKFDFTSHTSDEGAVA